MLPNMVSQAVGQLSANSDIIAPLPHTLRSWLRARLMQSTDAVMSTATMRCLLMLQGCPTVEIMRWLSTSLVGKA